MKNGKTQPISLPMINARTTYDDDTLLFSTMEECKQDIMDHCVLPYRDDQESTDSAREEMESIFSDNIKTARNVYYLADQAHFIVMDKTTSGDGLYKCLIQCDDDETVQKLLSILQFYVQQGVSVIQVGRGLFVSQMEKRSYLYSALFHGTVVKWIRRMRQLIF
jgi:hypothetical protein